VSTVTEFVRSGQRSWARTSVWSVTTFVVVAVLYGAGAQLAWDVFGGADIGLAFFPPAGVTLAALMILPRRLWPAVLAAIWAAEIVVDTHHGVTLVRAMGWALANSVEPLLGAIILIKMAGRLVDLGRRAGMARFLLAAVVAGPVAASIIGATVKVAGVGGSWTLAAIHWWAGDGLGVLAIGAPILSFRHGYDFKGRRRAIEGVVILIAATVASVLAFSTWTVPPTVLVLPVLIVAALRFGTVGVGSVTIIIAVVANISTAKGRGPFAALDNLSRPSQLAITQLFLASTVLSAWFLAIETTERATAQSREASERIARVRAEATHAVGMLSAGLVRALTIDQIADVLDTHAHRFLGASRATIALSQRGACAPAGTTGPLADAIRDKRTIALRSLEEVARTYPRLHDELSVAGLEALAVVPLPHGSNVSGAMSVSFATPQTFDDQQVTLLTAVAHTVGQALERAIAFDAERRLRESTEALTRVTAALFSLDSTPAVLTAAARQLPEVVAPAALDIVAIAADGTLRSVRASDETHRRDDAERDVPQEIASLASEAMASNRLVLRNRLIDERVPTSGTIPGDDVLAAGSSAAVPIGASDRRVGAVVLSLASATFDETQVQQLRLIGEILSQSLARAARVEDQHLRRRFAEVLAEVSSELVSSTADPIAVVSKAIVEGTASVVGADAGVLFEVESDRLHLVRAWGYRADHVAAWGELRLAARTPLSDAARGKTIVTLVNEQQWLAQYPQLSTVHQESGYTVTMAVPLIDARHASQMVLGLSFVELPTSTETIIGWLPSMADRWTNLLIQARLAARAQTTQHRLAALQRLTAGLAVARNVADVAETLSTTGATTFGATHVWCSLHDPSSRTLHLARTGVHLPSAETIGALSLDEDPVPATDAFLERTALYFRSADELATRYPDLAVPAAGKRAEALAVVPLMWHDTASGVLVLSYPAPRSFDAADRGLLETVADLCGQALERIRLAEHQHHAVIELQHAMLGEPDRIRFAHVGFAYRPADRELEVGGDWYDVIALPGGRAGLVVGDVVGHDVTAAATMGQLRSATRALAMIIDDPADVVTHVERFMSGLEPAGVSTMLYAVFDPRDRSLRYHCAGHLPPLLLTSDACSYLEGGRGAPLGVATSSRQPASTTLPADASLLLYTDGLVERRDESIDAGLARLVDTVERLAHLGEDALCRALVSEMVADADVRDDIAVLAIRPIPTSVRERIRADRDELRPLRHRVRAWLQSIDVPAERIDDVVLGLGEAVSNAIEHAYNGQAAAMIDVEGIIDGDRLEITIRDEGKWRPGPSRNDGGRGIDVMRAVTVEMEIETGSDGTTVRLVHELGDETTTPWPAHHTRS
jgi:integral membrane sensor domain MASE1/GAF domain-containing protein/anti-sigma regulatory factor (Ser/Thr protein kinase)